LRIWNLLESDISGGSRASAALNPLAYEGKEAHLAMLARSQGLFCYLGLGDEGDAMPKFSLQNHQNEGNSLAEEVGS